MEIQIREAQPADAGAIARIHIDTGRAAYAGIIPTAFLADLSYPNREAAWVDILTTNRPATSNYVATTDGGQVVGFAGGGPERDGDPTYRGELYAIYLLPSCQRRGAGRLLVAAVAQRLLRDGFASMRVWVLQDNHPACRFYESLGGAQVGQKTETIGGARLVEIAYGWQDLSGLVSEHASR